MNIFWVWTWGWLFQRRISSLHLVVNGLPGASVAKIGLNNFSKMDITFFLTSFLPNRVCLVFLDWKFLQFIISDCHISKAILVHLLYCNISCERNCILIFSTSCYQLLRQHAIIKKVLSVTRILLSKIELLEWEKNMEK